jgi:hypothetical protein
MLIRSGVPASLTLADFAVRFITVAGPVCFCAAAGCCAKPVIKQKENIDPRSIGTLDFIEPPTDCSRRSISHAAIVRQKNPRRIFLQTIIGTSGANLLAERASIMR